LLSDSLLKELFANRDFSRTQKVLFCLAAAGAGGPQSVAQIREHGVRLGLRGVDRWNISALLSAVGELAIRTSGGWELTSAGLVAVRQIAGISAKSALQVHADALRELLPRIKNVETSAFVEEAIGCSESRHYRAAVVLSWVGAVAVLYDYVIKQKLSEFNSESLRRDAKWKAARTTDDLTRLKEYDFLQIAEAIGVLGKNTKQELEAALKLRNACGHPSSFRLGESRAAAHLETLALNVYAVF
jgi:hypothetical protein